MRLHNILTAAALTVAAALTENAFAKNVVAPKMYMFGFAASFNDTIVHMTDIIEVDSAWIDSKTKFLLGVGVYSAQLRNYLADEQRMPGRTTVVMYSPKRTGIEKKYLKMKRLYSGGNNRHQYEVRTLSPTEFRFQPVNMSQEEVATEE